MKIDGECTSSYWYDRVWYCFVLLMYSRIVEKVLMASEYLLIIKDRRGGRGGREGGGGRGEESEGRGRRHKWISSHHEVAEAQVVVEGDVASRHPGVQPFFGDVQRLQCFECQVANNESKDKLQIILTKSDTNLQADSEYGAN